MVFTIILSGLEICMILRFGHLQEQFLHFQEKFLGEQIMFQTNKLIYLDKESHSKFCPPAIQ